MTGDLDFVLQAGELPRDSDVAPHVQEAQRHLKWCLDESARLRRDFSGSLRICYGAGPDETADVFPAKRPGAPIVVFFPGKDWQACSSQEWSFVAAGLHAHDLTVIVLNQSYCPAATISEITRQGRAALQFIHREATRFSGDPTRIFIAGHAAGGQQIGMMVATAWASEYKLPADLVKGAISICGIFDLRKLRDADRDDSLRLSSEIVQKESPILNIPSAGPPLLISVGAEASPRRLRQSVDYLAACQQKGLFARLFVQQGRNQLSAVCDLAEPTSALCRSIVEFIADCETAQQLAQVSAEATPAPAPALAPVAAPAPPPPVPAATVKAAKLPVGPPIEVVPREGLLPASFAQQRLWLITEMFPDAYIYNEPIQIEMDGSVDAVVLSNCLTEIVRRHEAWRTVFTTVDGEPRQKIEPPSPFKLDVIDLTNAPPERCEREALEVAVAHARRRFDLKQGPLVRALLIQMDEARSRLVVTAHHIVVDGVSFFNVFLPELSALYAAFSQGHPSPLPELQIQPADFAIWQRRWLGEAELAPKIAYWKKKLAGFSEARLPADFQKPLDSLSLGAREPIALSPELSTKLRELGHRAGASLFTTLLAAWKTLLYRYIGQSDILVGSAAAGRPRSEFEPQIGYFNNNLVLRTQFHGGMTFFELIGKVAETLREAREHQDVPFDRLVNELKVDRNPYKNPFFENTFILMPPLPPLPATPDWHASRFDLGVAKVEIYLELHQRPSGLVGHIEYQTEVFSAATIRRMIGHLQVLLEAIARDPAQRLDTLPLLSALEESALVKWQGLDMPRKPDGELSSLEQLFEEQAAKTPQAIAIEHNATRLSYVELDARANQLAHYLRTLGVGPDSLVGLYLERSIDAMVGILGVLKAGGAYVPLDPSYPRERLRFMLEDAELRFLLANAKNLDTLPENQSRVIVIDRDWPEIAAQPTTRPQPLASAKNLAYVIYTSGSTGKPKGVLVERRGLHYLAKLQEQVFRLGVSSRVLQFFSLNFDVSVWEMAMTWPVGATLVIVDAQALLPGANLLRTLREKDIHVAAMTPSALAVTPHEALPLLHTLITAGEALPEELVNRWGPGRRFFNGYGPTETTVVSLFAECRPNDGKPPIGRPLAPGPIYILDAQRRRVPTGVPGELYIGGPGVARGYLKRPELTAERFLESPFPESVGQRLYKTGDRVKWLATGDVEFLGRFDHQIKLRGYRIELGEIEAELGHHPAVEAAAVTLFDFSGDKRLAAYVVAKPDAPADLTNVLKSHLRTRLPEYMVPATFMMLDRLPRNGSGKTDRAALPPPILSAPKPETSSNSLEQLVSAIWREVLGISDFDRDAPFFDIGGHSLALAKVQARLLAQLQVEVDVLTLLRLPTVRQLAAHLATLPLRLPVEKSAPAPAKKIVPAVVENVAPAAQPEPARAQALAITGMAIRAPGVRGPSELWEVVGAGREMIRFHDLEQLVAAGADPTRVRRPDFIPAEGVLDDADLFDAGFFGYSDADAAMMDPQQRVFLECAYEAFEHAGIDPTRFTGRIGVFAGAGMPRYWLGPVSDTLRQSKSDQTAYRAQTLNAPDFLATRVAFKLGLRGPAVAVQTACSTSLSAVHLARQSLLAGECDVALAGGVSLTSIRDADRGYIRVDGGIESADGHCRPFDYEASGLVRSSGVAIVVMRRLAEARADHDTVHAIMLSSAMNNDGASKMGFTAISEDGVANAIEQALKSADVDPRSVGLVEAHGTGTRLGDPTEVRALSRAYRRFTEERGYCALGSVKANLGHLDAAAGAAGLIKAALSLSHKTIPPLVNFRTANPLLELAQTPFFVDASVRSWPQQSLPRRAGVSSLGIGGTNVHVILEEAAKQDSAPSHRPAQLLCLSARSEQALGEAAQRLRDHLAKHPTLELADVAYTLATGRTQRACRMTLVCQDVAGAIAALGALPRRTGPIVSAPAKREVVFLFPGHGVQYPQMGRALYEQEAVFRGEVETCLHILRTQEKLDLLPLLAPVQSASPNEPPDQRLDEMTWAQPFLFTIEYALAQLMLSWGMRPTAMLGHSLGEYVAACIGGVMSLPDALALVSARGRLMDSTPAGGMITAFADEAAVAPHLDAGATISTYAPSCVVISGLSEALAATRKRLEQAHIETSGVRVSRASHSPVMRQVREAFRLRLANVELRAPQIPIISNLSGTYLTDEQATSIDYWADHLCRPVRLRESFDTLLGLDAPLYVEVGPGNTLGTFLKAHPRHDALPHDPISLLPGFRLRHEPLHFPLFGALGRLWELGLHIDWPAFYAHEQRRRIPLPTYPFQRKRYLLSPSANSNAGNLESSGENAPDWDRRARAIASDLNARTVDDVPGLRERMEQLTAHLVLDFFARRLGADLGRTRNREALQRDAGIVPKFAPMFTLLLQVMERGKLFSATPTGELSLRTDATGQSERMVAELRRDFPAWSGIVDYLAHCVGHYDEALTGAVESITVLYPDGTNALFRECMAKIPPTFHEVYMALEREVILDAVAQRKGRKTRILEVGAGHGSLTWPLLESLRSADVEYFFTDIGQSFLYVARTEAEKRGIPFVKTARFDLSRPYKEQGLSGGYDLIVGIDSIHVAVDIETALANLRDMLAPGGALIFGEVMRVDIWFQLIWGLAPGYWDIAAARGGLAMDLVRWRTLLTNVGFVDVDAVPRDLTRRKAEDCGLLIARKKSGVAEALAVSPPALAPAPSPISTSPSLNAPPAIGDASPAEAQDALRNSRMKMTQPFPERTYGEAPRTAASDNLEQLVKDLFQRMLGDSNLASGTSFFSLGGDSLLAVHLLAELRLKTGREIKMREFLSQPTVDGIVSLLRQGNPAMMAQPLPLARPIAPPQMPTPAPPIATPAPAAHVAPIAQSSSADSVLLPLQKSGSKRPFFCVHPIDGGALCYAALAGATDANRPFFGLQSPMHENAARRPHSIAEMAAIYIESLKRVQPTGPYLLGGWSFGGVIAIEMARQLQQRQEQVAKLVLFDVARAPSPAMGVLQTVDGRLPSLAFLPAMFASATKDGPRGEDPSQRGIGRFANMLSTAARNLVICEHHFALWQAHQVFDLDVPATHFVAESRPLGTRLRVAVGNGLPIKSLQTQPVAGDHLSMMAGENVAALGRKLAQTLDAADPGHLEASEFTEADLREAERAVLAYVNRFTEYMNQHNGVGLGALFAPDARSVIVTSGESVLQGIDVIKQHYTGKMELLKDLRVHVHEAKIFIFARGKAACVTLWVDSDQKFLQDDRSVLYRGSRLTMVLEKHEGAWRTINLHYSLPVGGPVDTLS